MDVGGYTWARVGFSATPKEFNRVKEERKKRNKFSPRDLDSFWGRIKDINELSRIVFTRDEMLKNFKSRSIESLEKEFKENRALSSDGKFKVGKYLLLGEFWSGEMELKGRNYEDFKKYINEG